MRRGGGVSACARALFAGRITVHGLDEPAARVEHNRRSGKRPGYS